MLHLSHSRYNALKGVFLCLCLVLYSLCAFNLPALLAPDEPMRMLVPMYIVEHGCLPLGNDPEIINQVWGTSYGFSAYGSSLLAVPFIALSRVVSSSPEAVLLSARCMNVLLSVGTLFIAFKIGDVLQFSRAHSFLYVSLIAFLPQYVFLSSYFNSDILEFFSTGLTILFIIKGLKYGWTYRCCIGLGISLGIVALSNYYAYGIIPASVVVYFGSIYYDRRANGFLEKRSTVLVKKPLLILVVALLVGGWFFLRNIVLYDGDIFGMQTSSATSEVLAAHDFKPSNRTTPLSLGIGPIDMMFGAYMNSEWLEISLISAIGYLGPMQFQIGNLVYTVYILTFFVGFVAAAARFMFSKHRRKVLIGVFSAMVLLIPFALSVYYSWSSDYQPQGRYFMAGILLFMLIVSYGWQGIFSLVSLGCRKLRLGSSPSDTEAVLLASCDQARHRRFYLLLNPSVLSLLLMGAYIALFLHVFFDTYIPMCFGPLFDEGTRLLYMIG